MNDSTYWLIVKMLRLCLWRGRLLGAEHLPQKGPAVFIGNHAAALGPIGAVCVIPLRLYPWTHWKMLSEQESPEYLRVDFVEKSLHLHPPLSRDVAERLSPVVISLLRGIGCIPVHRGQGVSLKRLTWDASLNKLRAGQCLLVFPEDPDAPTDPQTGVHAFMHGALWLADVFHRAEGKPLPFYPLAVHPRRVARLHPPVMLSPQSFAQSGGKQPWLEWFERTIREMLLEIDGADEDAADAISYASS